ncbi:hypothetical protein BU16DRAFT_451643, partial [Lophium mytilinum]
RPEINAPIVTLEILKPEYVTPGYIFLAPYRNIDSGPYIYDNNGRLVWSGAATQGSSTAHNVQVCKYKGSDHLCFFQGHQHHGYARGHGVIMDNRYRVVQTVEAAGSATSTDMHEFRLINDGKSALVTVYSPRQFDLADFGIGPGMGWIMDGVFQEIDVETGELIFEWRSLDHIAPSFSYTLAGSTDTSGNGLTAETPWDYFHINSIDKNADGDYMISARHMAAVYKISGKSGRVMWELNGANPTFRNENLHFSSQHHALWLHENQTHTILSMFDNASNGPNRTNPESRGLIIAIDHIKKKASKIREWLAPEEDGNGVVAASQGNLQVLSPSNVFIGWGDHAYYSEHLDSGEAVMYGKLAFWGSDVNIYRCNKFQWKAQPLSKPAIWSYSLTGTDDNDLVIYTSWNGATEVRYWNFYVSDSPKGPWELAGTKDKFGFETEFHIPYAKLWSFTEALDQDHKPIARSSISKTFVPSIGIRDLCDKRHCKPVPPLDKGEEFEKLVPKVGNRGANYTRGYDTSMYYLDVLLPNVKLIGLGWPAALAAFAMAGCVLLFFRHTARKSVRRAHEFLQTQVIRSPVRGSYMKVEEA